MFDLLFGWRKASKCNKLTEMIIYRLNVLKHKRSFIVTYLRDEAAQLITLGDYQSAFSKVEQIYKDECIVVAYDILVKLCEVISKELSYIRRNQDCPHDIKEAISSLIFASARIGDLAELVCIRKLFTQRYGRSFETMALEGHHVNFRIRENLSENKVTDEVKYKLFDEIAMKVVHSSEPLVKELTDLSPNRSDKESSSENSTTVVNEDVVADEEEETGVYSYESIEEFSSPFHDVLNGKDQRCFIFLSSNISKSSKYYDTTSHRQQRSRNKPDHQNNASLGLCTRRAMSMPCERSTRNCDEESGAVKRSYSLPAASPPHVHPKLPEYDNILAMSMALKEEHLRKFN